MSFNAYNAATAEVEHYASLHRQSVMNDLDMLYDLGVRKADFDLLWPNGPRACPDWGYAELCGPEIHEVVCRLFDATHAIKTADEELAIRALPKLMAISSKLNNYRLAPVGSCSRRY